MRADGNLIRMDDGAVFEQEGGADAAGEALEMGIGGESAGPGDVAMAVGIEVVAGFSEGPGFADEDFFEREIIGGDVRFTLRETLFADGELVHESKAEIVLFRGEVNGGEGIACAMLRR